MFLFALKLRILWVFRNSLAFIASVKQIFLELQFELVTFLSQWSLLVKMCSVVSMQEVVCTQRM